MLSGFACLHPALQDDNSERVDLIERYFHLGLVYSEIFMFLGSLHGCFLSLRQLKRILKQRGLGRRRNRSNPRVVCDAIEQELRGSAIGYRLMTQKKIVVPLRLG